MKRGKASASALFILSHILLILPTWSIFADPGTGSEDLFSRPVIARGDFDYPPFEYIDENGEPAGFNVELLRAIAEQLGIEIVIDLGNWSLVTRELLLGEVDLITGMLHTVQREEHYDFSAPHNVLSHSIYTRKGSDIKELADLSGKTLFIQAGDVMHNYVRDRIPGAFIIKVPTYRDAILRLSGSKDGDAALLGRIQAEYLIQQEGLTNLQYSGTPVYPRKYCFAVREGNSDLLAVLNDGLVLVRENGTYDRLYAKWFGQVRGNTFGFYLWRILLFMLLPILVITAIVLSWIITLRRQVRQRTEELNRELQERTSVEQRFRNLFEGVPVSIWEEDFSEVRKRIDDLQAEGVNDFQAYLREHPEIIDWMVEHIRIIEINPATLDMYKAKTKEQLLGSFAKVETAHIRPMLEREFLAIAEGQPYIQGETKSVIFTGEERIFLTTVYIPPPSARGIHHMLVSMVDITEQKRTETKLAASLSEKDVLLKELHHRVKNNMQLMSSLISLQSSAIQDKEMLQVVRSSENRIRSMALVHELLYQSEGLASIDLGYYLQSLVFSIMESHQEEIGRRVSLEHSLEEVAVSIDTAIPCGLIINELVSNAMEHAFSGEDDEKIILELQVKNGGIHIRIADNGRGMDGEEGPAAGSPDSTGIKGKGSMGLTLVEALTSQLQGQLLCKTSAGGGTEWRLSIPSRPQE